MKKQKRRKVLLGRVYDLLIIPLYIVVSILFVYLLRSYTNKFTLIAVVVLGLILIISLLTLMYRKNGIHIFRRVLLTLLCAIMIFATFKINSLNRFFTRLGGDDDEAEVIKTQMNVYSLQSNDHFTAIVESMDDLDQKRVGIQAANDKEESEYVLQQIKDDYDVKTLEYNDYKTMFTDLYNGYVDAIIVNANATSGIEATMGPLKDFTIQLKTYTHEKTMEVNLVDKDITKEVFTVLISGEDEPGTPSEKSKTDVNMIAIVNPISNQITFISIPRDSFVPNPAYNYANDKLTHTGWDGVQNTMEAMEAVLQIDIDFYVKVSFTSLIEIVDAVGGIEVDVPFYIQEQDENRSFEEKDLIRLQQGVQHVNGKQALAFARHRDGYVNQDLGRSQAQIQVIKGITKKLITTEGLTSRIEKVLDIVPNYVLTNFSNSQMKKFIKEQIDDMKPWAITNLSLANGYAPGPEGYVPTASDPSSNASIYYLSEKEVKNINAFYRLENEEHNFNEFKFDLSNLYKGLSSYKQSEHDIELAD